MNPSNSFPGLIVDAKGNLGIALISDDAIGVSVSRFSTTPDPIQVLREIGQRNWVAVYRKSGNKIFMVSQSPDKEVRLATPEENESGQFAIELALKAWPEWGTEFRQKFKERSFIPYRAIELD